MTGPLVSVLVPIFRVEHYIERCARSVLGQTYQNLEFIFVDDATDDSSMDILNRVLTDYPERMDNVHIVHHEQNRGLAAARNTAVKACHGEFVFHVDSDDWVETDAIELMVEKQKATDADIITAEAYDEKDGVATRHLTGGWNLQKTDLLTGILTYKVSTTIWRRLIRKRLYTINYIECDECGSGGEDIQVFPRLVYYSKKVSGIPNIIYHYDRSNRCSISNNVNKSIDTQLQGLSSVRVMASFFADKAPFLASLVAGLEVRNIHYRMRYNVVNRNKKGYCIFLRYMKESDSCYWSQVNWHKPYIRLCESHYYSMMLLIFVNRIINRVKAYIK
jgi:glycosyltransferase involved in cell wall biosynthesis